MMTDARLFEEHALTLLRKKFTQVCQISPEMFDAEIMRDYMFDSFIMRLKVAIYGEELPSHIETQTVHVPDGWREQYRHDHAEKWWMRRSIRKHPIRTRAITLTATWENMAAYPWAQLRTQPVPQYLGAAVRLSWMTANLTGEGGGNDA